MVVSLVIVGLGLVVVRLSCLLVLSLGFCGLTCCYSLVLYFYKTALTGKFSEIFLLCCIV